MGGLTYGLIEGGAEGFAAPLVLAALTVAAVALATFFAAQLWGAHPMVPLELFRSRPVVVAVSGGFTFTVGFYGLVFLLSLYLQQQRGLSPLATGLVFLPMTALSTVVNLISYRVAARIGRYVSIAVGQLLMAASLLGLSIAAASAPIWLLAGLPVLIGIGGSLAVPTIATLLVGSVPAERVGTASGVLNTSRQLGGALAVAIFGALVAQRESFLSGMQLSLMIAAALLIVTASASLLLRPNPKER
jgi:DHA2 family methylenomycin A resistance protein-like MFS transporter